MSTHRICKSEEVVSGRLTAAKLGEAPIVLTRLNDGSIRAASARCPHHGADLRFGCLIGHAHSDEREHIDIDRPGEVLRCPWHGFEFDMATGDPLVAPPQGGRLRLRLFKVEEVDGDVHSVK